MILSIKNVVPVLMSLILAVGVLGSRAGFGDVPLVCPFQGQGGLNLSKTNNAVPVPPGEGGGVLPGSKWQWLNMGQPIPQCTASSSACVLGFVSLNFETVSGNAVAAVCNYSVTQAGNPEIPSGGILLQLQQIPISGTVCGSKFGVQGTGPGTNATSTDPHYVCWRRTPKLIDCPLALNSPAPPSPWAITSDGPQLTLTPTSIKAGATLLCGYPGGYQISQPIPAASGSALVPPPPYTCITTPTGFSCQ